MTSILAASAALDSWIERHEFRGWDPHDGLNSPILRALSFGNRYAGIVWLQLVKRSPINTRRLLLVPKGYNPKAMGLFLASYQRKGDPERTRFFADWLEKNAAPGYHGAAWGYNFDWPNRDFFARRGTPTIVNTAFIGLAFLDLDGDLAERGGSVARSACEFLLRDLNRQAPAKDELCFSYTPIDTRQVHNANVLGAWLLAETWKRAGGDELADTALAAARFTARRQRPDGMWLYGENPRDSWIDNFHTAYVLVALRRIGAALGTSEFDSVIARGFESWKTSMITAEGIPKYYADRLYPIDAHCVAQSILTFLEFEDVAQAAKIARWAVANMQERDGHFDYQLLKHYRIRIPYMRWCQAWMQRALTELTMRPGIG
ncbi:MAG TPA: delta-aminolevulinic acid dehydratase [Thermoanaerobaculia bacterium]|nr:delta-aminolevulinic acid dehydratase [Thermoanaerobaculia bacterium]